MNDASLPAALVMRMLVDDAVLTRPCAAFGRRAERAGRKALRWPGHSPGYRGGKHEELLKGSWASLDQAWLALALAISAVNVGHFHFHTVDYHVLVQSESPVVSTVRPRMVAGLNPAFVGHLVPSRQVQPGPERGRGGRDSMSSKENTARAAPVRSGIRCAVGASGPSSGR